MAGNLPNRAANTPQKGRRRPPRALGGVCYDDAPVGEPVIRERLETLTDHAPCRGCAQHLTDRSGCRVVEEGSGVPLDAFLGRETCYLKERLARFAERYLAHRPRSLLDGDDLAQEVFQRLLADVHARGGGFGRGLGAFLAYLRQTATRCAISAERRERGRVRCGNCRHYAPYSGLCLKEGHAWTHRSLDPSRDPRGLEPACREFVPRRDPVTLAQVPESRTSEGERFGDDREGEITDAVHQALVQLAVAHPRAALVVRARLIDGRTYDELAEVGASVRTMKRDFQYGVDFLKRKLHSFGIEKLAPARLPSRSPRVENA